MLDNMGVMLTSDQKKLVHHAVNLLRWNIVLHDREKTRVLDEILLHLENEDSHLVFVENMRPRFDVEEHLDVLLT